MQKKSVILLKDVYVILLKDVYGSEKNIFRVLSCMKNFPLSTIQCFLVF